MYYLNRWRTKLHIKYRVVALGELSPALAPSFKIWEKKGLVRKEARRSPTPRRSPTKPPPEKPRSVPTLSSQLADTSPWAVALDLDMNYEVHHPIIGTGYKNQLRYYPAFQEKMVENL